MLLLDTSALVWLVNDPSHLGKWAFAALRNDGAAAVSPISVYEIALEVARGRVELLLPVEEWYAKAREHHGLVELPISAEILAAATRLPPIHHDPIDRILIATALHHGIRLVTGDVVMGKYPKLRVVW